MDGSGPRPPTAPRIRLLGQVATVGPDGPVPTRSTQARTLLALLATPVGVPVSLQTLVDELWAAGLPKNPRPALHVQVTRLRTWLGDGAPVRPEHGGYVLDLDPAAVDAAVFDAAADRALRPGPGRSPDAVLELTAAALALWGGEPFPGCAPGPRLDAERHRLVDRRLRLLELRARTLTALDRADEAAELVLPALAEHRDRERLALVAVRALHAAGRVPEALAAYAATRRHLRAAHGVDPSPELVAAERAVLGSGSLRAGDGPRALVVGRDAPLARLRALLDDPDRGHVVVLAGEAGIGKSSLLRAARAEARARGAGVAAGAFDLDAGPLAGWAEALTPLAPMPRPENGPFGPALRARLAALVDTDALLLTLDDVHHGDAASLGALAALVRLGLPAGVLVVVAAREPDAVAHPLWRETHADLARADTVVELALTELDEATVRALVGRRLAAPDREGRIADALWARTRGHALHLGSLLDAMDGIEDDPACLALADEVPARLRPLLQHQVGGLPRDCRDGLAALAVLAPIPAADLGAVLGEDPRDLAVRLRPAARLGLVDSDDTRFSFRHDLTARAVLDVLPRAERAELHRRRFAALEPGADPFDRLRHALGAATLIAARTVADVRLAAGWAAYRRGGLDDALELTEAAAASGRPTAVVLQRGLVLAALGEGEKADDELDRVLDLVLVRAEPGEPDAAEPDAAEVDDVVRAAVGDDAHGISVAGRPRRLARLRRVRDLALSADQRVQVLRALVVEEQQLLGDGSEGALTELQALVTGGGRGTGRVDPARLAQVRLMEVNRLADAPMRSADRLVAADEALALAVRSGDDVLRLEAEELLVAAELAAGRVDEALARHARLAVEAHARRRPRSMWAVDMVRTTLLAAAGDIEAADAAALETMTRAQELAIPDAVGAYGVHLFGRHWLAGTLPALGGLPAGAAAMYPHVAAWSAGAAVDAAQAGDLDAARVHLAEFHRRREGRAGHMFDRPGLAIAAIAAYALDDAPTARAVLDGLPPDPDAVVVVGLGAAIFGPVPLAQGLARWVLGEREAAAELFTAARDLARRHGWAPWVHVAERFGALVADDPAPAGGDDLPFGVRRH